MTVLVDRLRTNRDLYLFVAELVTRHARTDRDLEQYLTALWLQSSSHRTARAVSLGTFARLIEDAFSAPVPGPPSLAQASAQALGEGYQQWEHTIASQVADLHEMRESGIFANEYRYLGVDAPSGAPWYNFDPETFLECAFAGTFEGWRQGDDTSRQYVPGKVAVFDSRGETVAVGPQDSDEPVFDITDVCWERFARFLLAGQSYE